MSSFAAAETNQLRFVQRTYRGQQTFATLFFSPMFLAELNQQFSELLAKFHRNFVQSKMSLFWL